MVDTFVVCSYEDTRLVLRPFLIFQCYTQKKGEVWKSGMAWDKATKIYYTWFMCFHMIVLYIQGMALSLGDKINLSQKKATSVVDPTPAGSKEGSSS